jgi:hypothetical protein
MEGINIEARTDLRRLIRKEVNADRYIRDILEPHVVPFAPFKGEDFLLITHDNAEPHIANVVRNYINEVNIVTLNWPARSSDLNPIEHVWDRLGQRVLSLPLPPQTLGELPEALVEVWKQLDGPYLRNLISSMSKRCQAVIAARGDNKRY